MEILIIVPTLNSYHLLPKLVKTLQSQSYMKWRVLFVDGNSSKSHREWLYNFCRKNKQFDWIVQKESKGIFGAMNDGIKYCRKNEWILFWGSDDCCPHKNVFQLLVNKFDLFNKKNDLIDLVICKGRYVNTYNKLGRCSSFENSKTNFIIDGVEFNKFLLNGFSPPHQGVLFSPQIIEANFRYNEKFLIAADLESFLRLSKNNLLKCLVLDLELVQMSDKGVSSRFIFRKLFEVLKAYKISFGNIFLILFFKRYFQRIKSLLSIKNNDNHN